METIASVVAHASSSYLWRLLACEEELRRIEDRRGMDLLGALVSYRGAVEGIRLVAQELLAALSR